jgi:hypothetical protein
MKTFTKYQTTLLINWRPVLGLIWMLSMMMPVAVMAQASPDSLKTVNLGSAADFVILAETGISTTGTTAVTGDLGISPYAATAITGFGLIEDPSNTYWISTLVNGKIYAANNATPTPVKMSTAISDMEIAYTDAANRTLPNYSELYTGDLSGQTLTPGLYKWSSAVSTTSAGFTISGNAKNVWIFQVAQDLTIANGAKVTLIGGALASNIFWQVAGKVVLGTSTQMQGVILCKTLISMNTGTSLNGRAMAQTAVTLDGNAVTQPATVTAVKSNSLIPQAFVLYQNYPNPFNPETIISYQIPITGRVSLKIFNVLGNQVAELVNGIQDAGKFNTTFDGSKFSSGIYFYQLKYGSFVSTKKLVLLK